MMARRIVGIAQVVMLVFWTPRSLAQSPTFEVAVIKLSLPGTPLSGDLHEAGHLHLSGISLKLLIAAAWQVKDYAIVGGPAWLDTDRFDVAANAAPGTSTKDVQLMLRSLLVERFQLEVHSAEKVMGVHALILDKGGPKLQERTGENSDSMGCSGQRENGLAQRTCKNMSLAMFADSLPGLSPHYIDLPVVNLTGLTGRYDFKLSWQPLQLQQKDSALAGPTIFEAVRNQLGLKLEARKLPMPTVVIDKIDRLDASE